jgi:hypothetical protein
MYIKMAPGSWTAVRNVDFGEKGAKSFVLRAKGTGTLEFRTASKGQPIATVQFASTEMEDHVFEIDPETFKGTKNLFFLVFTEATNVQFDAWQFFETAPNAINPLSTLNSQLSTHIYDLNGRRLQNANRSGLVIEQYQDVNGITRTRKRVK